jgi:hypothetical protein
MAERRVKIVLPPNNQPVEGFEVPIESANEKWNEYVLEDGTVIRAKMSAFSFIRIDNQWDQENNPQFAMRSNNQHIIVSAPDKYKRKTQ